MSNLIHSAITENIKVEVKTNYEPDHSQPDSHQYLFAYTIKITNQGDYAVQLLNRHWHIFDSLDNKHEVEGPGVVGKQPVIKPGQSYQYESACNLKSEIGSMHGTYQMVRLADNKKFEIAIPRFELIIPYRNN